MRTAGAASCRAPACASEREGNLGFHDFMEGLRLEKSRSTEKSTRGQKKRRNPPPEPAEQVHRIPRQHPSTVDAMYDMSHISPSQAHLVAVPGGRCSQNDVNIDRGGVGPLKNDVNIDRGGVGPLKNDVHIDREGVGPLKNDVNIVREGSGPLKNDVNIVPASPAAIRTDNARAGGRILIATTLRECVSDTNLDVRLLTIVRANPI